MDNKETLRVLRHMRNIQVRLRREAVTKQDMTGLKQAQFDVSVIDDAIADEIELQKGWVAEEAARLARLSPAKQPSNHEPFPKDSLDPRSL